MIIEGFLFFFKYGAIQDQKTSHHKISLKCEFKVGKDEAFTRLMQLILLINYRLKIHTQRLISLRLWRVRSEKLFFASGFPSGMESSFPVLHTGEHKVHCRRNAICSKSFGVQ